MPRLIFKNNFEVALAQPTTTSDTTITIRSGSGFPTLGANERVVATIVDAATGLQFEIVTVTAVVGNVLTVQRAQEGTTARAWAAGDLLSIRTTAASLTNTVRNYGAMPSGINLNALTGSWFGQYFQDVSNNAQASLNYPIKNAGCLEVIQTGVYNESCIQKYTTFDSHQLYQRYFVKAGSSETWSDWVRCFTTNNIIPIVNGGTGQTTIQGVKTAFGFGTVADQNIVPTSMGGTGSADNAQAWLNIRPQGSTPLAGDPVNDYDAATKRWVENLVNTGTVGPSMNGVMNYGVGDFHLRNSRAYIQPYEVVADGQLLNRADWPELWAYAQMLSPIADADWIADSKKRGRYSSGNGTTTFRVPDFNGVQTGSIKELFGRGDGGVSSADGDVFENGAPDINGTFRAYTYSNNNPTGAVSFAATSTNVISTTGPDANTQYGVFSFSANRSNAAYGRSSKVRPDCFVGVWVIRASGGFVAANTSWSVINGDATRPLVGKIVDGGRVISKYQVNGVDEATVSLRARATIGGTYYARLAIENATSTKLALLDFDENGKLTAPGQIYGSNLVTTAGGIQMTGTRYPDVRFSGNGYTTSGVTIGESTSLEVTGADGTVSSITFLRRYATQEQTNQIAVTVPATSGTIALQGTSGLEYKKDIQDADVQEAINRIKGQRMVNFVYKDDEKERQRYGIIAEEAELIAPQYIKHNDEMYNVIVDEEGNTVSYDVKDRPSVDGNPIIMDLMGCVQNLLHRVEILETELAALKAAK